MSIETRDPHVPQPAAPDGEGGARPAPTRWGRRIGRVFVVLWVVVAAYAWLAGSQVVSLDRLESDLRDGSIGEIARDQRVPVSSWWDGAPGESASDPASGAIVYTRTDDLFPRSYVVVPTSSGTDAPWAWGTFSGGWVDWYGEELSHRDALLERVDAEIPQARVDAAPEPWVDGVGWDVGFAVVPTLVTLAALGVLVNARPTYGNRWYWLWVIIIVPGGLGWLAYARREHLAPRPRARRDGGVAGLFTALVATFLLGLVALLVGNATGMTVIPR